MAQQSPKSNLLFLITKSNFGGAQKYVFDLATSLSETKYNISVAFGGNGLLAEKLRITNIKTFEIPCLGRDLSFFGDIKSFFEILSLLKKERPDIVHLNSSKVGGIGALAVCILNLYFKLTANGLRIKTIYTSHGWAFAEKRKWYSKLLIKTASWLTIILCDKVITVSEIDKESVIYWPFIKNKVEAIHNGIPEMVPKTKAEAKETIFKKIGTTIPEDSLLIGTISELHKNKGLEFVVKALDVLKNEKLFFIIIGDGEEKDKLKSLIDKLGLDKKVFITGFIENASSLLKAFDILTLTSLKEGLPYFVLEAGLSEVPIITTAVGGIPEIIDDMKSGILVHTQNANEISKAINFLIANPEKRISLAEKLRKRVERNFSLKRMVRETEALYKNIDIIKI